MSKSEPKVGGAITFVDPLGIERAAIVTAVHGLPMGGTKPSINVVYVTGDESKTDTYGRQIERSTSVVHQGNQAAHGMFWRA